MKNCKMQPNIRFLTVSIIHKRFFRHSKKIMSQCMRFPTVWRVRPAKAQISLRIRAVWSEPLRVAWIFHECPATDQASFGVCKLKRRLRRLVWVYTFQNATLLEITCHVSMGGSSQFSPLTTLSEQLGPNSWVSSVFIPAFIANIGKHFFLKYDSEYSKSI